jgi:hypothetical protein
LVARLLNRAGRGLRCRLPTTSTTGGEHCPNGEESEEDRIDAPHHLLYAECDLAGPCGMFASICLIGS